MYNESQISRMIEKIRKTKSGEIFKLNRKSDTPIDVHIKRTISCISLIDTEVDKPILSTFGSYESESCLREFVKEILSSIEHWDLILKQHFIEVAKKRGYEP